MNDTEIETETVEIEMSDELAKALRKIHRERAQRERDSLRELRGEPVGTEELSETTTGEAIIELLSDELQSELRRHR